MKPIFQLIAKDCVKGADRSWKVMAVIHFTGELEYDPEDPNGGCINEDQIVDIYRFLAAYDIHVQKEGGDPGQRYADEPFLQYYPNHIIYGQRGGMDTRNHPPHSCPLSGLTAAAGKLTWTTSNSCALEQKWRPIWPWVITTSLAGQTLGVSCFQWALKSYPTGVVLPIVALTPLVTIPLSWAIEKERPGLRSLGGGVVAVSGVVVLLSLK